MNTFLRTEIECLISGAVGGPMFGDCTANGKNVAAGLVSAGLCDSTR